jgi:uncharacterized protein YtpQ (UPF0354 family)
MLARIVGSPRDRFAAEALRIARRTPGLAKARYDRDRFAVELPNPDGRHPTWLYLSNVYAETDGATASERRERIERLIRIMAAPKTDETWESVRSKLRPVLRPVTFGQVGIAGMVPPISRAAMPHLRELIVVDQPDSMSYVVPARLDEWGVTVDDVFAAACANLAEIAGRSLDRSVPTANALIRMIDTGDGYFTSLLLSPGWLAGMSERMGERVIAFVPDTSTVVLCGLDAGGLDGLYEMAAQEYSEAVRSLSPVGYVTDARGDVVPYVPEPDDPAYVIARRSEVLLAGAEYGAQTRWLTTQYASAGIDVFVGNLLGLERPGEPAFTVAAWTDGITSLLPAAHFISFTRGGVVEMRVPWQVVADQIDLRPEPLLTPLRYRVDSWPPAEVIEALRVHAAD